MAWYYDGAFVWSMDAASFGEYQVCAAKPEGGQACERTPPREMPNEPMSLVINTAIGTWNGGMSALDGKHWPASFWIDYVRVWQPKGELNIGCNPPDYPTKVHRGQSGVVRRARHAERLRHVPGGVPEVGV